jgi:hypothetical protein
MIAQRDRRWLRPLREIRRSVLEQSLQSGPLEARRTAFSVALGWLSSGECTAKFSSLEL